MAAGATVGRVAEGVEAARMEEEEDDEAKEDFVRAFHRFGANVLTGLLHHSEATFLVPQEVAPGVRSSRKSDFPQ